MSEDDALLRLNAQTNEASRLSIANDVIQNFSDTSLSQLEQSIKNLHKKFLRLSRTN
jgi:dephospho-CoA kinase